MVAMIKCRKVYLSLADQKRNENNDMQTRLRLTQLLSSWLSEEAFNHPLSRLDHVTNILPVCRVPIQVKILLFCSFGQKIEKRASGCSCSFLAEHAPWHLNIMIPHVRSDNALLKAT
jgi:hypothetical protein